MAEFDAIGLGLCEQGYRIAVDELDLREMESDHAAVAERRTDDIQVFRGESAADAQPYTAFE
jgi:hypothetical protein